MLRYRILRYTPNLVRDERVNIGVLLEEAPAPARTGRPQQTAWRVAVQLGHSVRSWMKARIADVFQRRRILGKLEHRVPVEEFTHRGDPLKLDYGYRYNGTRGYLHAIALDRDISQSKVLAYTAESIRQRVPNSILTAVTSAEPSLENSRHQFIVQTLRGQDIAILPINQIDKFAEELRPRLQ